MKKFLVTAGAGLLISYSAIATEILLDEKNKTDLEISVYQNMALVKDARSVVLPVGNSELAFLGVAEKMKPESAVLMGDDIFVLEQNYNYDLITSTNLLQKYVGQVVKTAIDNPKTGETEFDEAKIISNEFGHPILQFSYGIDPNFKGRVIFPKIPDDLRAQPTLAAKIKNVTQGNKNLNLMYLTSGLSWNADYVATIVEQNKLNLKAWVTVNNVSGVDYKNAKINFIAGDVNSVQNSMPLPRKSMRANGLMMLADAAEAMPEEQSIAGYHLYNIGFRVDLDDNQTKQLSLLEADNVLYRKEMHLLSPLYFSYGSHSEFEKANPEQTYIIKNTESDNLGIPLPSGTVRFYQKDNKDALQFIGESRIYDTAKNEEIKLNSGKSFDVYASGSITENQKISNKVQEFSAKVKFTNSGDENVDVLFTQDFPVEYKILQESLQGKAKNIRSYTWKLTLNAGESKELLFKVRITHE